MDVIMSLGFFWIGVFIGATGLWLIIQKYKKYSGTILVDVDKDTEKIVYSLVLNGYPEELQFRKEVIFKIDSPSNVTPIRK